MVNSPYCSPYKAAVFSHEFTDRVSSPTLKYTSKKDLLLTSFSLSTFSSTSFRPAPTTPICRNHHLHNTFPETYYMSIVFSFLSQAANSVFLLIDGWGRGRKMCTIGHDPQLRSFHYALAILISIVITHLDILWLQSPSLYWTWQSSFLSTF